MSLVTKAVQLGAKIIESQGTKKAAKTILDNEPLLKMAKKTAQETSEVLSLRVKPDISIPFRPSTLEKSKPAIPLSYTNLDSDIVKGEIGNMAIRLEKRFAMGLPEAEKQLRAMFPGYEIQLRSKSAASIYAKIEKNIKDSKLTLKNDEDALAFVTDGIAGRLRLHDLSRKDVIKALQDTRVDNRPLTRREKRFVARLLNNDAGLSKTQKKAAEKYVRAVKANLAEKQSEPVYNRLMLSMMKDALNRNITTIEKLEASKCDPKIIEILKNNPKDIVPFQVPRFCNYRGPDGIAYFSNRQIRELEKLQLATGEKFSIAHCSEEKDLIKTGTKGLSEMEEAGIKKSGYTTTQMNFYLKDGSKAELQIRGKGEFGEIEHVDYDGNQGKGTINPVFDLFQSEKDKLGKNELLNKNRTRYKQRCYNHDRILELGGKEKSPALSKKINKVLSRESMENLHNLDVQDQKAKMETFVPYIEQHISLVA